MIRRTSDAEFLNLIANSPDVRPYVGPGIDPVDLTALIGNSANFAIEAEHGGWVLINLMPGVYELHTMFLTEGRGEGYFAAAREALRYMFTETNCLEILTRCPDDNPAARMAAVKVGFRERFRREGVWRAGTADACGVSFQAFTLDDWQKRDDVIEREGASFWLAVEGTELGLEGPRDGDALLNRLVGSVLLMMRHGQTAKAVAVFNRAAAFAGYTAIVALREDLFDIGGVIVHVKPDGVGVILTY